MGQPVVSEPRKELVGGGTNEKYVKGKLKLPCAPPVLATGGMHHHMLSRNALGLCTLLRPVHMTVSSVATSHVMRRGCSMLYAHGCARFCRTPTTKQPCI